MVDFASICESPASEELEAVCALNTSLEESIATVNSGVNTFFLLFAGAAVFLMQAGFAMLCAGSVRSKNVKNIMLKNLLDACGGALGFFTVGYALAYGRSPEAEGDIKFIGDADFFLQTMKEGDDKGDVGYAYIGWFFQFAFAATAATIVAGTVAERCKMAAYLCYSVFLTAFVYPIVVHSTWASDGFLSAFNSAKTYYGIGVIDFAGSGVVHLTGGATALVAAIILGPRKGRFYDDDGNKLNPPADFQGHSTALQILGTFILWFGWYGFNPGSALEAGYYNVVGLCAVTTTLSAASGCVTAMFTDTIINFSATGEVSWEPTMAMNGCLGGLVGITAGCSVIQPWVACIVGVVSGWVYYGFSKFLIFMRIDDAVDAVPVHFACGIWGVLAVGLLSEPSLQDVAYSNTAHVGLFYDFSDATLLLVEATQVGFILAWVAVTMIPFFVILRCLGLFRVDPLEEEVGLDVSHHGGAAYNIDEPKSKRDYYNETAPTPSPAYTTYEQPGSIPASTGGYSSADESA